MSRLARIALEGVPYHIIHLGNGRQQVFFEERVKPLSGEFEGLLRLRVGNHRIFFDETEDTITIHRVRDRREAYR